MHDCPECSTRLIPIYYGYVDHAVIERVVIGDLALGYRYGLENFFCKKCKKSLNIKQSDV